MHVTWVYTRRLAAPNSIIRDEIIWIQQTCRTNLLCVGFRRDVNGMGVAKAVSMHELDEMLLAAEVRRMSRSEQEVAWKSLGEFMQFAKAINTRAR